MRNRYSKSLTITLMLIMAYLLLAGWAWSATVTLSSGRQVDLSPTQVDQMKKAPGVYFLEDPSRRLLNGGLEQWEIIQLPPDLGGGFLLGPAQSINRALDQVGARPPSVKPPPRPATNRLDDELRLKRSRFDARLSLSAGLRRDDFDWNVAGDSSGSSPNVRTEIAWDDLSIFQLTTDFRADFRRKFHLRSALAYGRILSGQSGQSDYLGDDRSNEFSRVEAGSGDGHTLDASIGFGYRYTFSKDRIGLTPLIGYAYNAQHYKMNAGFQTVSDFGFPAPLGPIAGLDNTYTTHWRGPWIGLEVEFKTRLAPGAATELRTAIGLAYHRADYAAEGDWNLHTTPGQPTGFDHDADGSGLDATARVEWMFKNHWGIDFGFVYRSWHAGNGTETAFFSDGSSITRRLNDVNWLSYTLNVGLKYRF